MHGEKLEWFSVINEEWFADSSSSHLFLAKKRDREISPLLSRCNIYGSPPVRSAGMPITGPRDIRLLVAQRIAENAIISMSLLTKTPHSLSSVAVHMP